MELLTARYAQNLAGVLSCYDRILITGTLPGACFADGMTSFLRSREIRIFDYPQFALPLRERIRANAQALAAEHGATIEYIAKAHVRKEDVVAKVLAGRGSLSGFLCARHSMIKRSMYATQDQDRCGGPSGAAAASS